MEDAFNKFMANDEELQKAEEYGKDGYYLSFTAQNKEKYTKYREEKEVYEKDLIFKDTSTTNRNGYYFREVIRRNHNKPKYKQNIHIKVPFHKITIDLGLVYTTMTPPVLSVMYFDKPKKQGNFNKTKGGRKIIIKMKQINIHGQQIGDKKYELSTGI